MKDMVIEEVLNCIDRKTGVSYELAILQDGTLSVSDYDGNILRTFTSRAAAEKEYMIF